jgi:hypothetical protein
MHERHLLLWRRMIMSALAVIGVKVRQTSGDAVEK